MQIAIQNLSITAQRGRQLGLVKKLNNFYQLWVKSLFSLLEKADFHILLLNL